MIQKYLSCYDVFWGDVFPGPKVCVFQQYRSFRFKNMSNFWRSPLANGSNLTCSELLLWKAFALGYTFFSLFKAKSPDGHNSWRVESSWTRYTGNKIPCKQKSHWRIIQIVGYKRHEALSVTLRKSFIASEGLPKNQKAIVEVQNTAFRLHQLAVCMVHGENVSENSNII